METSAKESSGEKKILVRIRNKQEPAPAPLFSENEVRRFVSEFVSSWIRGDIVIRFPTAAELSKKTPLSIPFPVDPSINAELKIKEHYIDLLAVCAGIRKVSPSEQQNAIQEVFKMLLMFRSANRIEGKIISNDIEKRLLDIEKEVNSLSKLVEQITGFLFSKTRKSHRPGKTESK